MKKSLITLLFILGLIFISKSLYGQVESVPIQHPVYTFLKEMNVKGILSYYKDDEPVLSRYEVLRLLNEIAENNSELSNVEKKLYTKYLIEFSDDLNPETSTQLFNPENNFFSDLGDVFTNKVKYLFAYKEEENNIFFEGLGHFYHGQRFAPGETTNSNLYDIGFRIRGTAFKHLGYNLTVLKGGVSGNKDFAEVIEPRLKTSFKWIENAENIGNYDFTHGYLKYHAEPVDKMDILIQLGREDLKVGYGYGSKLILSGDNPTLDFIKFNFDYGIIHFSSIHASTVGEFSSNRNDRYTKYMALNKLKLAFPKLFDIGIGETIIYSGRGFEFGYMAPVVFYKFVEMALQDRDNGNIYFDFQSRFIKDFEIQATFLLDENILSNLGDLDKYTNKTAYQLGAMWYSPLSISDLSLFFEYTRIRPYVYTHYDNKNNYTAFGANLGHRIGPNSDELMTRAAYNLNEWIRLSLEYRYVRKGNNVYDEQGNLIKNVGGDIFLSHGEIVENETAPFLDGVRVNSNIVSAGIRIEPVRDFIFDISYNFSDENYPATGVYDHLSYGLIKFTLEY